MSGSYTGMNGVYDPEKDYLDSMDLLRGMKDNLPEYDNTQETALRDLYQEITGRPKFSYDPNEDALYQSYKQSYIQQGKLAMEDAMGQAAGLTGGYGNTYAQTVGQQQYGSYLQRLSDLYPELYSMAYNRYLDEGQALQNQYDMLSEQEDKEYNRYMDRLNIYYREMDTLQDRADIAYDRGVDADKEAYDRQEDAYKRLAEMMLTMGYVPTEEEMLAAGMSQEHVDAYLGYYNSMNAVPTGSGGGKSDDEQMGYDQAMARAKSMLDKGKDAEAVNGEIARMVAQGLIDADVAQQVIIDVTKDYYKLGSPC